VGVEPNSFFAPAIAREMSKRGISFPTRLVWKKGEGGESTAATDLDVDASSFDFVIATHVLCSVDVVEDVLGQVRRALKPGGRFVFLEHTWHPSSSSLVHKAQQLLAPVFNLVGNGCHFRSSWEIFVRDPEAFRIAAARAHAMKDPALQLTIAPAGGGFFRDWDGEVEYFVAPIGISVMQPHVKGWVQKRK